MKIKSYFAESVQAAVIQARKELGPDAMLVNSRRCSGENEAAVQYEVIFGLVDGVRQAGPPNAAADRPAAKLSELAEIRKQIQDLKTVLTSATPAVLSGSDPAGLGFWRERLAEADVLPEVACEILERVQDRLQREVRVMRVAAGHGEEILRETLAEAAQKCIAPTPASPSRLLAFVGPPGAGKTTTLLKLAIRDGLAQAKSVAIVAADPHRVAASEQLKVFASILSVPFYPAETFGGLMQSLKDCRHKDLVFIDTPGYSLAQRESAEELAGYFEMFPEIAAHLVLPASMRTADLSRCADLYSAFRPASLIFTKVDEAGTTGGIFSESIRLKVPVSFLASGQSIPEDIEAATCETILGSITQPAERAVSVA